MIYRITHLDRNVNTGISLVLCPYRDEDKFEVRSAKDEVNSQPGVSRHIKLKGLLFDATCCDVPIGTQNITTLLIFYYLIALFLLKFIINMAKVSNNFSCQLYFRCSKTYSK